MIYEKGNEDLNKFNIYNPLLTKKQMERLKNMKAKTEKAFKLEDGKHSGTIKTIEYVNRKNYEYLDIQIMESETKLILRYGVPFKVTENTALGQLIVRLGCELEIDKELDVENNIMKYNNKEILKKDDSVEFLTMTEKTDKGTFSTIITASLKKA